MTRRLSLEPAFEKYATDYAELFTFAACNAGPAGIAKLRRGAAQMGLDPNRWFQNVEIVAAKRIGRATARCVANIVRYAVALDLGRAQQTRRNEALQNQSHGNLG